MRREIPAGRPWDGEAVEAVLEDAVLECERGSASERWCRSGGFARASGELTVYELDGEALIFDARTADTHHLNATACHLFRQLRETSDPAVLADMLVERYQIGREEALRHVERFLEDARRVGLLGQAP